MSWLFIDDCPNCGCTNKRYWQTASYVDYPMPYCIATTCACGYQYVSISNPVACLACRDCRWAKRGYVMKVMSTTIEEV